MLEADYLNTITEEEVDNVSDLDMIILGLIIANMKTTLPKIKTPDYEAAKIAASNKVRESTNKEINKYLKKSEKAVKKAFEDAAKESLGTEKEVYEAAGMETPQIAENEPILAAIQEGYEKTNGTIRNYTRTTAIRAQQDFIKAMDEAFIKAISDQDYDKIIFETLKDLARKGVMKVSYAQPNGTIKVDHADVAVRRALLTGLNQTYAEATELYAKQMGINLVQVSQHQGARTGDGVANHKGWQGKVYQIEGSSEDYKNLRRATGYGTGEGLCGWNCRHSFGVYIEGVTEWIRPLKEKKGIAYKGKNYTFYEATQEQRRMERNIRKWKREYYLAKETNQPSKAINDKINYWTNEVKVFSKLIGEPRRYASERVVTKIR